MIALPEGFDVALLVSEFYGFAAPFIKIGFIISVGFLLVNMTK